MLTREQFDQVLCYILEEDFAFWHSCLSERKHPTLTSYSRISQLPPSDFVPFCCMNRYMERFSLPHMQPFAATRQIAFRIRTYGITLVRLHSFPMQIIRDFPGFRTGQWYTNSTVPLVIFTCPGMSGLA